MLGQTSEKLSLLSVGGEIPDQDAICRVRAKLLEMNLHVLHWRHTEHPSTQAMLTGFARQLVNIC